MTLSTTTNFNTYTGNGGSSVFAFTYDVFQQSDIVVSVADSSGNITTLAFATDYTVQGLAAGGGIALPGTITLVDAGQAWLSGGNLATGYTLTVSRVMPLTQLTSLRNQGEFFPEVVENTFDQVVMQIQQMQQQIANLLAGNIVYTDIITGSTYRIVIAAGVISAQQLS